MDEPTNHDLLSDLMSAVEEHQDDLKHHQKTLRQFRSRFFIDSEDTELPCYVKLDHGRVNDLKKLTKKFKKTIISLCQCLNNIDETKLVITCVPEYSKEEDHIQGNYEEKLSKSLEHWKTEAKQKRKNGHKSFVEWYYCDKKLHERLDHHHHRHHHQEEERKTLNVIRFLAIDFGFEVSHLIMEYFTSFIRPSENNKEEIERKIELVKSTIRSESLVDNIIDNESIVVERFIRVVESIERELMIMKRSSNNNNDNSSCSRRRRSNSSSVVMLEKMRSENEVLGTIFNSVIYLETVFNYPLFPNNKNDQEVSLPVLNEIKGSLISKLKETSLEIRALKKELFDWEEEEDPELKKHNKQVLDMESEEIWNGLDWI